MIEKKKLFSAEKRELVGFRMALEVLFLRRLLLEWIFSNLLFFSFLPNNNHVA